MRTRKRMWNLVSAQYNLNGFDFDGQRMRVWVRTPRVNAH